jgi:hypothetical protein
MRIKPLLSKYIAPEQFGFLEGKLIHEAIGSVQEDLHSIKVQSLSSFVLKLDLSKAYDHVPWTFLELLLLHLGFSYEVVKWLMACVTPTMSF